MITNADGEQSDMKEFIVDEDGTLHGAGDESGMTAFEGRVEADGSFSGAYTRFEGSSISGKIEANGYVHGTGDIRGRVNTFETRGGNPDGEDAAESQTESQPEAEPDAGNSATLVETKCGMIRGFLDEGIALYIWRNIPYGEAPVGELRWKAPVARQPWEGVLDATVESTTAVQTSSWTGLTGAEDCLNLEIYRPATDEKDLPVVVYLHGGNNQTGNAARGDDPVFTKAAHCVYVSLNYRLGLLGFNALPALKTGTALENSGNYTLLDIALALDWVKENIGAFGGDGSNITIAGSSAGGRDVMALLISPIFEGKFQKAISYSGGMTVADPEASARVDASFLAPLAVEDRKADSLKAAYEWLLTGGDDVREYLYSLPAERIISSTPSASIRMAHFPHLFTDGTVLPADGFDTKQYNSVPLIMFTGTNEFSMFAQSDYFGNLDRKDPGYEPQVDFANKYGGMLYELFNAEESAGRMSVSYGAPIYLLTLNGAGHTSQNTVLAQSDRASDAQNELAAIYPGYLYNFLRTGDPNGEDLPVWIAWTAEADQPNTLFLDAKTGDHASVEMVNRRLSYQDILAQMDADETVPAEEKQAIISQSMNGRWFSAQLDAYYQNADLWDVEPAE